MNCRFPRPNASVRIICLPWGGGGASFYTAWGKDITEDAEVYAYCMPGRESRYSEPCDYTFQEILDSIVKIIHDDFFDKPFIFVGHSMGSLLGFFVAMKLKELYNKEPEHMFFSGTKPPHSPHRKIINVKEMPNEEFIARWKALGGTPTEIFDRHDLLELFLPPMKADFSMLPDMMYKPVGEAPPLSCSIDFIQGTEDIDPDIELWKTVTSGAFTYQRMPGGHFYLKNPENMKKIISLINFKCSNYHQII